MNKPGNPILIIGAGLGVLSAAIHLATHGQRVLVLEKHVRVGGKIYHKERLCSRTEYS